MTDKFTVLSNIKLLSANAFKFDKAKTLSSDLRLDLYKFKPFADNQLNMTEVKVHVDPHVLERIKNSSEKEQNAGCQSPEL